jgi:hypothetical protein
MCGSFVHFPSICEQERALYGDANGTRIEQAPYFRQLHTVRSDLGCRDRDAQILSLRGAEEA